MTGDQFEKCNPRQPTVQPQEWREPVSTGKKIPTQTCLTRQCVSAKAGCCGTTGSGAADRKRGCRQEAGLTATPEQCPLAALAHTGTQGNMRERWENAERPESSRRVSAFYLRTRLMNRIHITTNGGTWVWEKESPTSDIRKQSAL